MLCPPGDPLQIKKRRQAEAQWTRWCGWAARARLVPVLEVARMIKRHLLNVLPYFRHRITNDTNEGIARKIHALKKGGERLPQSGQSQDSDLLPLRMAYPDPTH